MKFNQLLQAESKEIAHAISDSHRKFSLYVSGDSKKWCDYLVDLFTSLSEELQQKYKHAVSSLYRLSPEEFAGQFGDHTQEIRRAGLYMYYKQLDVFLPPEEFVPILVKDNLVSLLCKLSKDDITRNLSDDLKSLRKEELITVLVREEERVFPEIRIENQDAFLEELNSLEWPFSKVIDTPVSVYDYDSRKAANILRGPGDSVHFNTGSVPEPCQSKFSNLLKKGVLFYNPTRSSIAFSMHPRVAVWFRERRSSYLEKERQKILSLPEPMLKKGPVLYHCEPTMLLRKATFLLGALVNQEIELTQDMYPKKSDVTKFLRGFTPKECQSFEQTNHLILYDVLRKLECVNFLGGVENPKKAVESLTAHSLQTYSIEFLGINAGIARELLDKLPLDRWISFSSVLKLEQLIQETIEGESVVRPFGYMESLLFGSSFFMGELDVALSEDKSNQILAVRRVAKSKVIAKDNSFKIQLLSNLEVPIAPDVPEVRVLGLLGLLSIKDLYTLVLDAKALIRSQAQGISAADYLGRLSKVIDGQIPESAKALITKSLVAQEPVALFDPGFPLIVNTDAQANQIRTNFKGKIISEYANRMFVIRTDKLSRLETKLKSIGLACSVKSQELERSSKLERLPARFDMGDYFDESILDGLGISKKYLKSH